MNELDERLHTLRDQLRTAVAAPGTAPARREPARIPARRVLAVAAVVVLVAVGAVALTQRRRGTTPPGYRGPATTLANSLASNRKPNASYLMASDAMAPTIAADRIVLVHTPADDPQIGEIVLVAARGAGGLTVRRLVAGPGDLVAGADGRVVRNGVAIDEPYLAPGTVTADFGPVQIPEGMWWVLGDNRSTAEDSRSYGPVDVAQLRGIVTSILPEGARDAGLPPVTDADRSAADVGSASACQASKTVIATATEAYYARYSAYPPDLRALQTEGYVGDYAAELDADGRGLTSRGGPSGPFTIRYEVSADSTSYTITASDGC